MAASRWEKQRGAWLIAQSRPGTSRRRRGEMLTRRARRMSRGGTGVDEASLREDITEPLWRRLLSTDEGAGEQLARMALVPAGYALVALTVGMAIAIAAVLYGLLWALTPRIGRLWTWPWLIAGAVLAAVGVVILGGTAWVPATITPDLIVTFDWPGIALAWLWTQLAIALVLTGLRIRASGWPAVPKHAVPKPEKDRDGQFRKTADKDKVRLDPLAGMAAADAPTREKPVKKISLSEALTDGPEPTTDMEPDEEPVFSDEEDETWVLEELEAQNTEGEKTHDR